MLKKTLLSLLLATSAITGAHFNLNLDMMITQFDLQHRLATMVIIEENIPASITFAEMENLIINVTAKTNGEIVALEVQFFEKLENNELVAATDVVALNTSFNQSVSITAHNEDNNGLALTITPTVI